MLKLDQTPSKENLWIYEGVMRVRAGMRLVRSLSANEEIVFGFSIPNSFRQENEHYLFIFNSNTVSLRIDKRDERMTLIASVVIGSVKTYNISYGVVEDFVFITSPDFQSVVSIIGGGFMYASKQASVNPATTAVDVPNGVCCSWQGRIVLADGNLLYFSDALEPETFVSENIVQRNGAILGLAESTNGALLVFQTDGLFALPADASGSGQIVGLTAVFEKLSDTNTSSLMNTVIVGDQFFVVNKQGIIEAVSKTQINLNDAPADRNIFPRRYSVDYTRGRIYPAPSGFFYQPNDRTDGCFYASLSPAFRSWWSDSTGSLNCCGIIKDFDGIWYMCCPDGVYQFHGNKDESDETQKGSCLVDIQDIDSVPATLREVYVKTDGVTGIAAARSTSKSKAVTQKFPVIGSDSWDATKTYKFTQDRVIQLSFNETDYAISFEIGVQGCYQSLSSIEPRIVVKTPLRPAQDR